MYTRIAELLIRQDNFAAKCKEENYTKIGNGWNAGQVRLGVCAAVSVIVEVGGRFAH